MSSTPSVARTSRRPISVSTSPGATMFTRIPDSRSSFARVSASASSAAFAMLYGAPPAASSRVAMLLTTTTSPRVRPRICGTSSPQR